MQDRHASTASPAIVDRLRSAYSVPTSFTQRERMARDQRRLAAIVSADVAGYSRLMLEMLLPGGTLFALLFFLYRRRECGIGWAPSRRPAAAMRTLGGGLDKPTQASIPTLEPQRSTKFRSES